MTKPPLELDNAFWRFSLATYAQLGVAQICLDLQAVRGLDVNLLLFCGWLGGERRVLLDQAEYAQAAGVVEDWRPRVVVPLRRVRTDIKVMPEATEPAVARLREAIKAVELESEQIEQALLFAWAARRWPHTGSADARTAIRQNLMWCLAANPDPAIGDQTDSPELAPLTQAALHGAQRP